MDGTPGLEGLPSELQGMASFPENILQAPGTKIPTSPTGESSRRDTLQHEDYLTSMEAADVERMDLESEDENERDHVINMEKVPRLQRRMVRQSPPPDNNRRLMVADLVRREWMSQQRMEETPSEDTMELDDSDNSEILPEDDESIEFVFAGPRRTINHQNSSLEAAVRKFEKDLTVERSSRGQSKGKKIVVESTQDDSPRPRPRFPGLARIEDENIEELPSGLRAIELKARYVRAFDDSKIHATASDLCREGQAARKYWRRLIEKQKRYTPLTTPKKEMPGSASSKRSLPTSKKKTKIIRIPRTSPLAKRFQAIQKRRQSQEFNIFKDPPASTKDLLMVDLEAFDIWIEGKRAMQREIICISAGKEQSAEFQLFESLAVELHKLQKIKQLEKGRPKFFDIKVLERLLKSIEGDEFVRANFTDPLRGSIGSGKLWDGDNDVMLG